MTTSRIHFWPLMATVAIACELVGCTIDEQPNPLTISNVAGLSLASISASSSVRVAAFGDQGSSAAGQYQVANALGLVHQQSPLSAVLLLGDNFYPGGVLSTSSAQWLTGFQDAYPAQQLPIPFYAVMGNHDYLGNAQADYDYVDPERRWILDSPAELLPVLVQGVLVADLFLIDSEQIVGESSLGDAVVAWTKQHARSSLAPWKILVLHHPAISHGAHGNTLRVNQAFSQEFSDGTFSMVLSGHDHDLEVSRIGRTDFVVSGAGSVLRPIGTGATQLFGSSQLGFVVLELTTSTQKVTVFGMDQSGSPVELFSLSRP